ncbi:MAG: tetratricopeptide repeat protein [Chloroflexi bacterium]|nr:tetratricopeptide repeat protein [Chloroflexota bacterium]
MASVWDELKRRNVVKVAAAYAAVGWLLVEMASTVLPTFEAPLWVLQTITLVIVFGLPVVAILAWVFELTPEGIKVDSDVRHDERIGEPAGQKLNILIIGALVLALGFVAVDQYVLEERDNAEAVNFVAVLPFASLGPDLESEYFAEAMTDELIGRLGRIEGLQIKSRQSVRRFKGTNQDIKEIAAQLEVTHILEGSVRKAEDRVRVSVQLTDASSGFEEWSDVFNDESDDWFALYEEMAVRIADGLDLHLSPNEAEAIRAHYTEIQEAYDAFWRGWVLLESFHSDVSFPEEKLKAAEGHFQRAFRLDPQYPLAVAGLSLANSYYHAYVDSSDERRERGAELARSAVAIDPDPPEVHVALGYMHGNAGDYVAAAEEFRDALRRGPESSLAWCHLAFSCILQRPPDPETAEEAAREAIRGDPTWPYSYSLLGTALSLQGRFEEALEAYETGAELNADYLSNHFGLGRIHIVLGNYGDALSALETVRRLSETDEELATVLVTIGAAHAGLDEVDEALAAVELGLELGFSNIDAIEERPYFATIRDDPRIQALVEKYRRQ